MLTPEQRIRQLKAYLNNQRYVQLAYLFGNSAKDEGLPLETVDIAVLFNSPEAEWHEHRQKLLEGAIWIFGMSAIRIVTLNSCDPAVARNVLTGGKLIYQRDPLSRAQSEKKAISTYLDTEHLRLVHTDSTKEPTNDATQLN